MIIKVERPPLFDLIDAKFNVRGKPVLFAWWPDIIYNPENVGRATLESLFDHEAVHCRRQASEPEKWWRRYVADDRFRIEEEIPAHVAEFAWVCRSWSNRDTRARALMAIARRLSGPLYGGLISYGGAMRTIRLGAKEIAR